MKDSAQLLLLPSIDTAASVVPTNTPCDESRRSMMRRRERIAVFENHYYIFPHETCSHTVLECLSVMTGWPLSFLTIPNESKQKPRNNNDLHDNKDNEDNEDDEYIMVRIRSQIRGGKGGFGSLLKSQSRQAGAHATTSFGACRDLQGRRLRHVNEAMAVVQAHEWHEKIASGQATMADQARAVQLGTPSRVPGWFLALPAWSDVSKKEYRKWQRQYRLWNKQQEEDQQWRTEQKQQKDARIQLYVETAQQASSVVRTSLRSAIQQGLSKYHQQQQTKKRNLKKPPPQSSSNPPQPSSNPPPQQQPSTTMHTTATSTTTTTHAISAITDTCQRDLPEKDDAKRNDDNADDGGNGGTTTTSSSTSTGTTALTTTITTDSVVPTNNKRLKRQPDPPTALLTLSGDVVLAYNDDNQKWQVQSQSNFATFGIVLDYESLSSTLSLSSSTTTLSRINNNHVAQPQTASAASAVSSALLLYWEVRLITGGLSQIGWARSSSSSSSPSSSQTEQPPPRFQPNSETGDGVGDDAASYAYDGSRAIILHQSQSQSYGPPPSTTNTIASTSTTTTPTTTTTPLETTTTTKTRATWKEGDVVGCLYDCSNGIISFTLNGQNMGTAFAIPKIIKEATSTIPILFPVASCNPKEILELHIHDMEMLYRPISAISIGSILATDNIQFLGDMVVDVDDDDDDDTDGTVDKKSSNTMQANHPDTDTGVCSIPGKDDESKESQEDAQGALTGKEDNHDPKHSPAAFPPPPPPANDLIEPSSLPLKEEEKEDSTATVIVPPPPSRPALRSHELEQIQSVLELEALGLDCLKETLRIMGVKCGGTLQQRAERLFSLRGLTPSEYPRRLVVSSNVPKSKK